MKLFVTGGAGFVGSNFVRHSLGLNKGYSVVNFDKLTYAGNLANLESVTNNQNYSFFKGDIGDAAAVEAALSRCSAVVHFAAESHVDRSIYEPAPVLKVDWEIENPLVSEKDVQFLLLSEVPQGHLPTYLIR